MMSRELEEVLKAFRSRYDLICEEYNIPKERRIDTRRLDDMKDVSLKLLLLWEPSRGT